MLNDLRYAVSFPTNGVSLSGSHSFQPGITAVSGRNGTGKSFIAEMLRYGLFGKKALRGPASDYKTLDMELSFLGYRVVRGKKETLYEGDEQLAVGADAVNKKILEILGFGLEVFDVVCAANQKESERLTKLTPARRKELIDDIVGLATQEAVEKACREEASKLRRDAETLTRALVLPVEPVLPANYRPSRDVEIELKATKALVEKRAALQRTIDAVGDAPIPPVEPEVDLDAIEAHEKIRIETDARYKALFSSVSRIPDATFTREQLDAAAALAEYDSEVRRRGPRPNYDYTVKQIEGWLQDWTHIEVVGDLVGTTVSCPSCGHEFDAGHDMPVQPPLSDAVLRNELRMHQNWATPLVEPKGQRLTAAEIQAGVKALDRADEKKTLQAELDALPELADRSAELRAARATNQRWAIYRAAVDQHADRLVTSAAADAELAGLPEPKHTVAELDAQFVAARIYETQLGNYDTQKARFDELSAEIAEAQTRAEGFTAGAKGLVEARRTLKAFLAPSLSRVASQIISQMTCNAHRPLQSVLVDEEMNITVDGQDVGTFNGAHATMINLALRLALGQVLVSRIFPVFIGDEIDSDLDLANAQAIADALGNLKDHLSQIVLISHKRLENVDQEIVL